MLGLNYARTFAGGPTWAKYRTFMVKRMARIYPLYFAVTVAWFFALRFRQQGPKPQIYQLLANLLMVQAWGTGIQSLAGPTWSLSTEFLAYILFPLLVLLAVSGRRVYAAGIFVLSVIFIYLVATSPLGVSGQLDVVSDASILTLLRCLAGFCFGLLCYRLSLLPVTRRIFAPSAVLVLLLAGLLASFIWTRNDLLVFAFFPLTVLALCYESAAAKLLFANRLVYRLGVVSYSLYLIHIVLVSIKGHVLEPFLERLGAIGPGLSLVVACLMACAAADVLYRCIEMPGRAMVQNLFLRRRVEAPAGRSGRP